MIIGIEYVFLQSKDYYKWILSDKYVAKKYAEYLGFYTKNISISI